MLRAMTCPACGGVVSEGSRFCPSCGHQLMSRGDERRVATVLFADLVGFTSLAETRDPEQVKNLVDSCFELLVSDINAFGGKVDKIIGDAILALFGAPVAHEDDADRAVRAALRMQQTVATHAQNLGAGIRVRIGVNTGEVLVGSLRAGGDYTAMGDVVNTAQRLQVAAEPGTVVVGPATHAATEDAIEYRELGRLTAKGREEPVAAWVAVEPLMPPGYRRRRVVTPLVGRGAELSVLDDSVRAAVHRQRAHLLLLLGEAGVGKSRLAEEVAAHARCDQGAVVYEGRCVPYGEANLWWPIAEALRQACGITADTALAAAEPACIEAVSGVLDQPPRSPEVKRIANGLLYLMGHEVSLRDIDPQRARDEAVRSLLGFIEASARRQPVVVVLSDLHWADDVVLETLGALLDRLSRSPAVLIATARPNLQDRFNSPTGRHNTVVINLDPLDRASAAELLSYLYQGDIEDAAAEALLDRSGGNPFFLEELVAFVASDEHERSPVGESTGPGQAAETGFLNHLPDTLRGLVAARIDALSTSERATLEDAAVWGRSGPVEALAQMGRGMHGIEDVKPALKRLVEDEILVFYGDRWRFRNDLVREVAYNVLTKAARARRHCGIATFLEHTAVRTASGPVPEADEAGAPGDELSLASDRLVDVISFHYAAAAELVRDLGPVEGVPPDIEVDALSWLQEAANRAQIAQAMPVAARLYRQALDLVDPDDDRLRLELLLGRAAAEVDLRRSEEALAGIEEAMALAAGLGPSERARCLLVLGDLHQKGGDLVAALETLVDAARQFRGVGDLKGVADAERLIGLTLLFSGQLDEAEASISAALDANRELSDRRGEAWALQNLAWISYVKGRTGEAEQRITASIDLFSDLADSGGLNWALGLLAFVKFHEGMLREAGDLAEQVLIEARERGDRWGEGMMLLLLASVRQWSGRAQSALVAAEDALATFRSIGDRFGECQSLAAAGRCSVSVGKVTEGLTSLHAAMTVQEGDVVDELAQSAAAALASAAVQIGAPYLAFEALETFPEKDRTELDPSHIGIRDMVVARGLARLQVDDLDGAIAELEVAATPDADGMPSSYALSALAMAKAARGDLDEAVELANRVTGAPRTTYSDRATASIAALLARASRGDASVADELADLQAQVDETDDRTVRAVVALARSMAATTLALPEAAEARELAEVLLGSLDLHAEGWRTIFGRVLGGVVVDATR